MLFKKTFALSCGVLLSMLCCSLPPVCAQRASLPLANGIYTGRQGRNHIQGIAVDEENGCIYCSFTTRLIKLDLQGNLIGSVEGLVGHLGCIAFCPEDGCVYGSLEFKKDSIGTDILETLGDENTYEDGFYIAVFDVSKITSPEMSAEGDGIMTAAYLPEVFADYTGEGTDQNGSPAPHRYGCSGIDGLCFAPVPGETNGPKRLWVAYGIYDDVNRNDNDHQVLLCYDRAAVRACAAPLNQTAMHRQQPETPPARYFAFTGNTEYGVQNLEYDAANNLLLMFVYQGRKPTFTNYRLYAADLTKSAEEVPLTGLSETGRALTLYGSPGPESGEITGWFSPYGQFGIHRLSDGRYLVAEPVTEEEENAAYLYLYTFDPAGGPARFSAPEEPGSEPATEPQTEPSTEPATEPTSQPSGGSSVNVLQRIIDWFRNIFNVIRGWFR